jgi:hypothetical protein
MIILVEGARESGKSYLVDSAIQNFDLIKYKFDFPYWISRLELQNTSTIHYASIFNPISIFEIADKIDHNIIMDRSIFSAYVWSSLLKRFDEEYLREEFENILQSSYYRNCKLIYIENISSLQENDRAKNDIFEHYKDIESEKSLFRDYISLGLREIYDTDNGNDFKLMRNDNSSHSISEFYNLIEEFIK